MLVENQHKFNPDTFITYERCVLCETDSIMNAKMHISNKSYIFLDSSRYKKTAIIIIKFYVVLHSGDIIPLTVTLRIFIDSEGKVIDEPEIFIQAYLSDILTPIYTYLRYILKNVYNCTDVEINRLIQLLILIILDASCGGGSSANAFDGTRVAGGKTKNKKAKSKKRKNKKTKKRKTRKQKY